MRPDRTFRRNFFVIAGLHVAAVVAIFLLGSWRRDPPPQIMWLEGGSLGGEVEVGAPKTAEPTTEPPPEPEPEPEPPPIAPKLERLPPPPPEPPAPSEIVTPQATPELSTSKPSTPKPETPKSAPAKPATPKTTPKITPKPKPKSTPKTTPKSDRAASSPKPKSAASDKPKSTPGTPKADSASARDQPGRTGGKAPGTGNGQGPGKTGRGVGASEFGWYFAMIHDSFHSRWEQPTSIVRGAQDFVTTLKIRISKDGTILGREIVRSSGDPLMDESVMTVAEKVQQIDPLPAGLGDGEVFEVNVAFKLDQGL